VREKADEKDLPFYSISSATGEGIEKLRFAMSDYLFSTSPQDTLAVRK
jgi:hypothetical protein